MGDRLLCAVSQRLKALLRRSDALARAPVVADAMQLTRLGGDEFCIVADDVADEASVHHLANRVLEAFAEPFSFNDQLAVLGSSIGVALFPRDGSDAESLMKADDVAMYHAKSEGRNRYSFHSAVMNNRSAELFRMEPALRQALERNEFVLHYQPIVDMDSGAPVGLEALLRWQHPEHGLLLPGRFIQLAEETDLIVHIGEWVLRHACAQGAAWAAQGLAAPPVSVNVSGAQFRRASLVPLLAEVLAATGIDPGQLKLEITESVLMRDVELTQRNLTLVRQMGVRLSIDDFGTGYSSLAYLRDFPVDELKLDRSFVVGIAGDARNAAIASAVIALGRELKLSVVAEGIEESAQATQLRCLGCPKAQGFFFHEPLPVAEVEALLRRKPQQPLQALRLDPSVAS
jgi:diguanylate cyclase (GGDEF)-like protein